MYYFCFPDSTKLNNFINLVIFVQTIFVLFSYILDTLVMLISISNDLQYSQNTVFSFEKGSNIKITSRQVPTAL